MPSQSEIQREITARIIEGLKQGVVPWRKPWQSDPNSGAPANVVSKRLYSGINPLLLDLTAMARGYSSRFWGTYAQFAGLGAQVKKRPADVPPGRWGSSVIFWKQVKRTKRTNDGDEEVETFPLLRYYTVFNVEQTEGGELDHLWASNGSASLPFVDYQPAKEVIDATNAEIKFGGNKAFYVRPVGKWPEHSSGDYICMPKPHRFVSPNEFYSTCCHELVHWCEVRLGWNGSYALGELIAEIGSCFLAAQIGIPCSNDLSNHTAYLADWLKALENDPKAILKAASQASKATELILSFSRQPEPQEATA